jgi:hypothetical protein
MSTFADVSSGSKIRHSRRIHLTSASTSIADVEGLRDDACAPRVFICATNVRTGLRRVFRNAELFSRRVSNGIGRLRSAWYELQEGVAANCQTLSGRI